MPRRVIVSLSGGLGNQLFQVTAALFMSGGNPVILDQSLGRPKLDGDARPEVLNFSFPVELKKLKKFKFSWFARKCVGYNMRMNVSPRLYEKIGVVKTLIQILTSVVILLFFGKKLFIETCQGLGYYELKQKNRSTLLIGYFQSYLWADSELPNNINKGINLLEFSEGFSKLRDKMLEEAPVVIHIRRGDYLNEEHFGILDDQYYATALQMLNEEQQISRIWLFTDSPEEILQSLPPKYSAMAFVVPNKDISPSETLELMRHGSSYVIANSSFSWWGAYLRINHQASVYAPKKWFKGMDDPARLIPPDWRIVPITNPFREF
jgi:hypothetical protein